MKIEQLNIIEFGGLSDRHYTLSEGLNIFEGDNETGKSTLWLFIKFMLYGMPKKGQAERSRSVSRTTHTASGTMTVTHGGETYRIERSFSENSRGRVSTLRLCDGEKVFEDMEPGEALLGVTRDIFENSVGIGQNACASLGGEKGAAAIRNILSSADEDVDIEKIQKKLDSIRVGYRHRNGKGGLLYELSESINRLEQRLTAATDGRLKIKDSERRLSELSDSMKGTEEELSGLSEITERLRRLEIVGRFDSLVKTKSELAQAETELDELVKKNTVNGHIPTAADGASLMSAANGCIRAQGSLDEATERLEKLSNAPVSDKAREKAKAGSLFERDGGAELLAHLKKARLRKTGGAALTFMGAILSVTFLALALVNISMALLAAVFAVLAFSGSAVLVFGIFLIFNGKAEEKKNMLASLPKDINAEDYINECIEAYKNQSEHNEAIVRATAVRESAEEHCRYLFSTLTNEMKRLCPSTEIGIENAQKEAWRINSFADSHRKLHGRVETLKGLIKNEENILAVYDEAELRRLAKSEEEPACSFEDAETKKRFLNEKLRVLKQRENDLKTELFNLKAYCEDPTALRDELTSKRKKLAEAEEYYDALVIAMDTIEQAASAMRGNVTPAIGRTAGEMISDICGGRYESISLGKNMDIFLIDKNGVSTTVDMMSGGMRDASYIALRISLMLRIFGSELPPLMMDETFCQLDDGRMRQMLLILDKLSGRGAQCLLFTCHKREAEACRNMNIKAQIFEM